MPTEPRLPDAPALTDPGGRGSACFYKGVIGVLWPVVYAWYGLRVLGREHLRGIDGGAITVSNHVATLDCAMVATRQSGRRFAFTAARANFSLPIAGVLVKALGCIPVPLRPHATDDTARTETVTADRARFDADVADRLARGWAVHFYPEGDLVAYDETLRDFRHGAFTAACANGVPIVPMVITWEPRRSLLGWIRRKPRAVLSILPREAPAGASREDATELLERCRAAMQAAANTRRATNKRSR